MSNLNLTQIEKAKELVDNISKWKDAYYNGQAIVSDQVYDAAEIMLKELIPNHPLLSEVGSATNGFQSINYAVGNVNKMLSLDKVYSLNEVLSFIKDRDYVPMVKLDGLSLRAVYKDGKINIAHTRGNGSTGDIVSNNFYFVNGSMPKDFLGFTEFSVHGEVVMLIEDFEKLNKERAINGEELFSNPRNAASGSLKQIDFWETEKRNLTFYAYYLEIPHNQFKTKLEMLLTLEKMGFKTPRIKSEKALSSVNNCIEEITKAREKLPVAIDGIVFELNDINLQNELGFTNHHPRYATAYKFASDSGVTRLIKKQWEVSRTGRIVPVGIIEPIELSGAVCTKVTLHNAKWVKDYRIADGEEVVIERSGDVIPHFVETVRQTEEIEEHQVKIPEACPVCNTSVVLNGVDIICPNIQCPGRAEKFVKYYVSKPIVNMDGIGEKLIEQLTANGYVKDPSDLFTLTKPQLLRLEKCGERKAELILTAIEKAKIQDRKTFLLSLGVESLGKDVSEKIKDFINLETLEINYNITEIDGIAQTTADSVINGLKEIKWLAEKLLKHITVKESQNVIVNDVLCGNSFCLSGSVQFEFDGKIYNERSEIQELIKRYGGRAVTGVSKKLNYLIAGPGAGSKVEKANKLGVHVISGQHFMSMLG